MPDGAKMASPSPSRSCSSIRVVLFRLPTGRPLPERLPSGNGLPRFCVIGMHCIFPIFGRTVLRWLGNATMLALGGDALSACLGKSIADRRRPDTDGADGGTERSEERRVGE